MAINEGEPTPVELLSIDELVEELKRRHTAVIVLALAPASNGDDGELRHGWYKGGFSNLIGMLDIAKERLLRDSLAGEGGGDE